MRVAHRDRRGARLRARVRPDPFAVRLGDHVEPVAVPALARIEVPMARRCEHGFELGRGKEVGRGRQAVDVDQEAGVVGRRRDPSAVGRHRRHREATVARGHELVRLREEVRASPRRDRRSRGSRPQGGRARARVRSPSGGCPSARARASSPRPRRARPWSARSRGRGASTRSSSTRSGSPARNREAVRACSGRCPRASAAARHRAIWRSSGSRTSDRSGSPSDPIPRVLEQPAHGHAAPTRVEGRIRRRLDREDVEDRLVERQASLCDEEMDCDRGDRLREARDPEAGVRIGADPGIHARAAIGPERDEPSSTRDGDHAALHAVATHRAQDGRVDRP